MSFLAMPLLDTMCVSACAHVHVLHCYVFVFYHQMAKPKQQRLEEAEEALALARDNLAQKQRSLEKVYAAFNLCATTSVQFIELK